MKQIGNIKLYDTKEVSEKLGLHIRTVRILFHDKILKGRKLNKVWHITEENLNEYLSGNKEVKNDR